MRYFLFPLIMLTAQTVVAQPVCSGSSTCVMNEDLHTFVQLARDHKCRAEQTPQVTSDPITIIVDREGRIYGSGTGERPFTLNLKWCNYEIQAKSSLTIQTARRVEPTWGFRLRTKATFGVLGAELLSGKRFNQSVDGGILIEPFFFRWVNINAGVGVRSFGVGLGADVTHNFGLYLGYAVTWGAWKPNPFLAAYFAF